jgi:hypothetical protein
MTSQWCDESEATRIIEALEGNPAFAPMVERAILEPYRRWAAHRDALDAYANALPFVQETAFLAAARAIPRFISLRIEPGPPRVVAQQALINSLAVKMTDAAMTVIEDEARAAAF